MTTTEAVHPIQIELCKALGQKKKDLTPYTTSAQLASLAKKVDALCEEDDKVWETLSEPAQMWVNKALRALSSKKGIPQFSKEAEAVEPEKVKPAAKKAVEVEEKVKEPVSERKETKAATVAESKKPSKAGYKGHRAGSQAELMRKLYDQHDRSTAISKAVEAGIKKTSAEVWVWEFKKRDAEDS